MWRSILTGLVMSACVLTGCDKDSDKSTAPAANPALPDAVKPRTSADKLKERVKLDLKFDPITIMVPPSWELKPLNDAGGMVILEGDTPTDTVGISIPPGHAMVNEPNVPAAVQVKQLESAARADAAKYPDLIKGEVVHDIPGARVIEQLTLNGPKPATQATTDPSTDATQTLQWIFTVCVPSTNGFTAYELRFTGLTLKAYKADQDFLRTIMNSMTLTAPTTDQLPK
jgi:hypothetical protein